MTCPSGKTLLQEGGKSAPKKQRAHFGYYWLEKKTLLGDLQRLLGEVVLTTGHGEGRTTSETSSSKTRCGDLHICSPLATGIRGNNTQNYGMKTASLEEDTSFPCLKGNMKSCYQKDATRPQSFPSLEHQVTATCDSPVICFHGNYRSLGCAFQVSFPRGPAAILSLCGGACTARRGGPMSLQDWAMPCENGAPRALSDYFLMGTLGN